MSTNDNHKDNLHFYSEKEEKLNIYSHGFGIVLSIIAAVLLLYKALDYDWIAGLSLMLFALSQMLIFSASTYYHAQKNPKKRYYANIIDHAMIYVSIAGTYSPICLITLENDGGFALFIFVWVCAFVGMLLKIKFTGKYNLLSTLMYLAMGWIIVLYWSEITANLAPEGMYLIIAGGVAYTIGAVLYMVERLPYNHALFHLFILLGASCHFGAIYGYV